MSPAKLAAIVIRFPWVFVVIFIAVTGLFGAQLTRAELDTEMKSQLPEDLPTRENLDKIEELFGGTDMAMVVLSTQDVLEPSTLQRVQALSDGMEHIDEFDRVISLFTAKDLRGDDGELLVEQAVAVIPETQEQQAELRKRLQNNSLVYGNLVSEDFQHTVIIGFLKLEASDEVLLDKLNALLEEHPGPDEVFLGGMPVTRVSLTQDMRRDMRKFLPVGLVIMLLFLLACFRQARGVLLPFVMTVMAIVVVMGLVPLMGWKIHTVTILLPVILLAVANDYGIHIMARYQEDNVPGADMSSRELASCGIKELARPIVATGVTTMIGLLCLLSHVIIPAKQLGILAACGVGFAMLGSLVFIPAVLSILPRAKPVLGADTGPAMAKSGLDRLLFWAATRVPAKPRAILIGSTLVAATVGIGSTQVVVDTNPMSFYRQTEPIWRSTHLLNQSLGGWAGVSAIVEGDIKDPAVLQKIDDLERHLSEHELVGTTTSIAGAIRKMNQVMHDDDPAYDRIPATRELVAQYLLLYSMSGEPEDFDKLVDFPYEHAQVMAKVTDSGTRAATEVLDYTHDYVDEQTEGSPPLIGGFLDVMADMVDLIVRGQLLSIALSIVLVGGLVGILMRSAIAAVLAMFPLVLALLMIFGVMGFFAIELNLITALLSSIMIGVGVDYTIHFLWRFRDERRRGLDPVPAVERTLTTAGRGIVFNGLSVVVGFAVLVISAFFPVRFFGLLVAVSILACLCGALIVLPAIVLVFRPRFLEPDEDSKPKAV